MKYKIYLIATLILGGYTVGYSQSDTVNIDKENRLKELGPISSRIVSPYQVNGGTFQFGTSSGKAVQTEGGAYNNFNNIVPGRASADLINLENGKSSRAEVLYISGPVYIDTLSTGRKTQVAVYGSLFVDASDNSTAVLVQQADLDLYGDYIVVEDSVRSVAPTAPRYIYSLGTSSSGVANQAKGFFNPEGYQSIQSYTNQGSVNFVGLWNVQRIGRETKNGYPILIDSYAKENSRFYSILNLPRVKVLKDNIPELTGVSGTGREITDQKLEGATANLTMADYDPYKMGYVSVASNISVSINELDLLNGGRFSVDAISSGLEQRALAESKGTSYPNLTSMDFYKVNYGYLDVNQLKDDNTALNKGYGELNLRLYTYNSDINLDKPISANILSDTIFTKTSTMSLAADLGGGSQNYTAVFLRGFTSPFEKLRADYMFYNLLTKPENGSMTSLTDDGAPVADPKTQIKRGETYFYALDASRYKFENITQRNELGLDGHISRARGGYNFSRYLRTFQFSPNINGQRFVTSSAYPWGYEEIAAKNFNLYSSNVSDPTYEEQRFNTGVIEVAVNGGSDFSVAKPVLLSNPYLVPINIGAMLWNGTPTSNDLKSLAAGNPTSIANFQNKYDVTFDGVSAGFKALHDATGLTYNSADGLILRSTYRPVVSAMSIAVNDLYHFNVKYDIADIFATAPTVSSDPTALNELGLMQSFYLQPLQPFGVYAVGNGTFKFLPQMKLDGFNGSPFKTVYDASNTETLTRSSREGLVDNNNIIIPDWFVIEAVVKDELLVTDRAAVRFFEKSNQSYDKSKDVIKNVKYLSAEDEIFQDDKTKALIRSTQNSMNASNLLYTTTQDGTPLIANTVGYSNTKEIPLYYVPSNKSESVSLKFSGISGFENLNKAWLVDRYENTKEELYEGYVYNFTSTPSSSESANRFLLVFDDEDDNSTKPGVGNNMSIYYTNSTLYINGLNDQDSGSIVQIFDVQGRIMGTTKIPNNVTSMQYPRPLGLGTFIVKIIGKRNYNSKFVNTQNN